MSREQMTDTFMKEEMSSMFSLASVSLIIRFLVTVCALIRFLWQIADAYDGGKGDDRLTFSYYEPVKESQSRDELRFSFPANREYRITVIGASALIHPFSHGAAWELRPMPMATFPPSTCASILVSCPDLDDPA